MAHRTVRNLNYFLAMIASKSLSAVETGTEETGGDNDTHSRCPLGPRIRVASSIGVRQAIKDAMVGV